LLLPAPQGIRRRHQEKFRPFPISSRFKANTESMMLRHTLLLSAAFGASLLVAPAFGQGYGQGYGQPAAAPYGVQDSGQSNIPPGSVGGRYDAPPPGYSDPYSRGPAVSGRDQVDRADIPPPSGYQPSPAYGAAPMPPAYSQPTHAGYGQQPAYGQESAPAQQGYGAPQQAGYGQQPYPQSGGYQQGGYNTASAPAVYAPNAAVVPGTSEAPAGPRIEDVDPNEPVDGRFRRQTVDYATSQPVGTVIIDTPNTYLYLVTAPGKAIRYGIGVGREGFTWAGTQKISRKAEWPDWRPPAEMIQRQPYLPRFMAGGPGNPMGARALYLGSTIYRIHGTNEPQTIGKFVSSGCIRMLNSDVEDLFDRVNVGSKVVVLEKPASAGAQANAGQGQPPVPMATGTVTPVSAAR